MEHPQRPMSLLRDATAIALGMTVPAMVSGRASLQSLAAAALAGTLILALRNRELFAEAQAAMRSRFAMAVFVAFAAMAISIPGSLDPQRSLEAWGRTFLFIGACTLFWSFLRNDAEACRRTRSWLIGGMFASSGIIVLAQLGFTLPLQLARNEWVNISLAWASLKPKAFAAAAACALPVLAWAALSASWGRLRWPAAVAGVFILVVIFNAGNKSALAGMLLAVLATSFAWAARRRGKWLAGWMVWAAVASGVVLTTVYKMPDARPSNAVWQWLPSHLVDTHRQQIWHFTLTKVQEKPWLGYGINTVDRAPGAREKPPGYTVEYLPSHPHNWALEVLAETGIVGFVPVLVAIAWAFVRHFRRYIGRARADDLVQIGLICQFWGSSMFNFSIWSAWWLITYFLLTALVSVFGDLDRTDQRGAA